MAEGFLKSLDLELEVFSAGTHPAEEVNPFAVEVMHEIGIDITDQKPKNVEKFLNQSFDYVITVCDSARESCPTFTGDVKNMLHFSIEDPASALGQKEIVLACYRKVRDKIIEIFSKLYYDKLKK